MTMKNSKINSTQFCVLLIGIFLAMRPIMENAMQAEIVGNDALITSMIAGIINLLFTLLICFVIRKNPGESFYDIIKRLLGSCVTKIIMVLLAGVFMLKLLIVNNQMIDLLYDAIYSDINWNLFVVPIYLTFAFLAIKGIKTLARCYQFFVPFAVVILIITILLSSKSANLENVLPLFDHTYGEFIKALSYILLQSCEFIFLFTFMENIISKEKNYFPKIIVTLIFIFLVVSVFYLMFVAVFGNIAPFVQETLIKMTQFEIFSFGYFKIDLFTAIMWFPIIVLECAMCVYGISYSLKKAFNFNEKITSFGVVLIQFITIYIPQINSTIIVPFFYDTIGIFVIAFLFLLPILLVIASFKEKKKREVKND